MSWETDVANDINRDVRNAFGNPDDPGARNALQRDAQRFDEPDPAGGSRGDSHTIERVNDQLNRLHSNASVTSDGQIVFPASNGRNVWASDAGIIIR